MTSRSDRSQRQVAPCVLLAKQVAATWRLFGAHAVISLAYVASVSVWFRSKEKPRKGTFGFDRARNETRASLLVAPLFSRSLASVAGVERGRCFSPPPIPFLRLPRRLRGLWLSFFSAKPHRNACYAGYNLVWRGIWTSFLINMADHMTFSHCFIYILSQRLVAGSVHTVRQRCFREILSPRLVARIQTGLNSCDWSRRQNFATATMIFIKLTVSHKSTRRIVAATCPRDVSQRRSDLSASVSRLPRPLQISSLTAHGCFFDNLMTR